jgi:hypothetical protein
VRIAYVQNQASVVAGYQFANEVLREIGDSFGRVFNRVKSSNIQNPSSTHAIEFSFHPRTWDYVPRNTDYCIGSDIAWPCVLRNLPFRPHQD